MPPSPNVPSSHALMVAGRLGRIRQLPSISKRTPLWR
jgi:hypothetical protein